MHDKLLKLTEEAAAAIKTAVETPEYQEAIKAAKGKDTGTFEVIISTEHVDRMQEIIKQDGWQLERYLKNPVVLWGHDYRQLPVGVADDLSITEYEGKPALKARGRFAAHEFAQSIRQLYDAKIIRATSVGFIPKKFDEEDMNIITVAELLEFSFVSVPANSFALSTLNEVGYSQAQVGELLTKGILNTHVKTEDTVDDAIDEADVEEEETETPVEEPETPAEEEKDAETEDEPKEEDTPAEEDAEPSEDDLEEIEKEEGADDEPEEEEKEDEEEDEEKAASHIAIEKAEDGKHYLKAGDGVIEITEQAATDMQKALSVLTHTNEALKHFEIAILALEGLKSDLEGKGDEEPDESADDQDPSEKQAGAAIALLSLRKDVQKIVSIAGEALRDARKEAEKHYK